MQHIYKCKVQEHLEKNLMEKFSHDKYRKNPWSRNCYLGDKNNDENFFSFLFLQKHKKRENWLTQKLQWLAFVKSLNSDPDCFGKK
jgi:hypothetical protein